MDGGAGLELCVIEQARALHRPDNADAPAAAAAAAARAQRIRPRPPVRRTNCCYGRSAQAAICFPATFRARLVGGFVRWNAGSPHAQQWIAAVCARLRSAEEECRSGRPCPSPRQTPQPDARRPIPWVGLLRPIPLASGWAIPRACHPLSSVWTALARSSISCRLRRYRREWRLSERPPSAWRRRRYPDHRQRPWLGWRVRRDLSSGEPRQAQCPSLSPGQVPLRPLARSAWESAAAPARWLGAPARAPSSLRRRDTSIAGGSPDPHDSTSECLGGKRHWGWRDNHPPRRASWIRTSDRKTW